MGGSELKIYIDADACPVKAEIIKVGLRHNIQMIFVSNSYLRLDNHPLIKRQIVSDKFDAADQWIIENANAGDIVITSDIPLAAEAIKKEAQCLRPNGTAFDQNNIGHALAMRELNSQLRDMGEIKGYNPSFSKKDRSNFLQALENLLQSLK